MINLKVNDADRILIIEMKGMISEAHIDGAIEALEEEYPAVGVHLRGGQSGGFSILANWQDLEGWEKGAKTLGSVTSKTIGDAVRRIAVIAAAQFADEQLRLADVAKEAEVRFFRPGQEQNAVAWLRSRQPHHACLADHSRPRAPARLARNETIGLQQHTGDTVYATLLGQ